MITTRIAILCLLPTWLIVLAACGDDGPSEPANPLEGGVLATFSVEGETFKVWTDDPDAIRDLMALQAGASGATIPNAPLSRGPGRGDHNLPYSWHMDPSGLELAEVTIEVCSAVPSFVEENVDEWMEGVGRYCPWSAELTSLEDFR